MKKLIGIGVCAIFLIIACTKSSEKADPPVDCGTITTTFSANVLPLMTSSCAKPDCHAAGSTNGPGALTNYTQIFNSRDRIRENVASGNMPQDATFSAMQKAIIMCWIDAGAQSN